MKSVNCIFRGWRFMGAWIARNAPERNRDDVDAAKRIGASIG